MAVGNLFEVVDDTWDRCRICGVVGEPGIAASGLLLQMATLAFLDLIVAVAVVSGEMSSFSFQTAS